MEGYELTLIVFCRIEFPIGGMVAIKEEWNKFVMVAKMVSDNEVQDVMRFISSWAGMGGGATGASFSFQ